MTSTRSDHRNESKSTAVVAPGDFSSVLARTIESIKDDPAQLRNAIYELARIKLQREAWQANPPLSILEQRRLMLALETAIERVETISSQQDGPRLPQEQQRQLIAGPAPDPRGSIEIFEEATLRSAYAAQGSVPAEAHQPLLRNVRRPMWGAAAPFIRAGIVAAFAVVLILVLVVTAVYRKDPRDKVDPEPQPALHAQSPNTAPAPAFPLPSDYGVYALSNGQLFELEALVGRVPDQRVFMSTMIKTPSRTTIPDGQVTFIVYRRDIAAEAPDRVQVRVIAKVRRSMTFNKAGQPNIAALDDQWAIRSTSYDLRVSPIGERPEMLMIRPATPAFSLPAGRYGLVIKGQAYDFTIAGLITDGAHCLERTDARNGTFYSDCRDP